MDYVSDGAAKANAIDLMAFVTMPDKAEYTLKIAAPTTTEVQIKSWLMGFYSALAGRFAVEWLEAKDKIAELEKSLQGYRFGPRAKCGMASHHIDCDCGGAGGDR